MQLHQLRYVIAVAETGSFRAASNRLFVSQSSVSVAVKDLEREMGVTVFDRTARGVVLTPEGSELLTYARSVIEQADFMERRYAHDGSQPRVRFSVSSQHYALVVSAFVDFVNAHDEPSSEFSLRESHTNEIIRDVHEKRSDLGVIYLSNYNDRVLGRALADANLVFTSLYVARPHAIVSTKHPLASYKSLTAADLAPYYRLEVEQGMEGSTFYAEEPLAGVPSSRRISIDDNGTLATLLGHTEAYALGTGVLRGRWDVVTIPLDIDETMNVGYIMREDAKPSPLAEEFLQLFCKHIIDFGNPLYITDNVYKIAGVSKD